MKKTYKIIIGIVLFISLLTTSFTVYKHKAGEEVKPKICCNNYCFNLEIADNNESRQLGLMYREFLPNNNGMLFIFDKPGIYSFWMKNTLIPLDGIRLDSNLKIVDIIKMEPCKTQKCPSYTPKDKAKYVLEINQGLIDKKRLIQIGDSCKLINKRN